MEDERAKEFRKKIIEIQKNPNLKPEEKRDLISKCLKQYTVIKVEESIPESDIIPNNIFMENLEVSYANKEENILGCKHYERKCQKIAYCCRKPVPCRVCHDEMYDHKIDRFKTNQVVCMVCKYTQKVGKTCENCGVVFASYFCEVCKFWTEKTDVYHCNDCGICRVGELGVSTFHCHECKICYSILYKEHQHIKDIFDVCPVCREEVFSSRNSLHIPNCGHVLHYNCLEECLRHNDYQCSLCKKSLIDMSATWAMMDELVNINKMPSIFDNTYSTIFCNDCEKKSEQKFHYVGIKCKECGGYNTTVISNKGMPTADEIREYDHQMRSLD